MIDHLTLLADNLSDDYVDALLIKENPNKAEPNEEELNFNTKVSRKTREILCHDANYKGLYLKLSRTRTGWKLHVSGSLKYFVNNQNYSFMDFEQTTKVIHALSAFFQLPEKKQFSVTSLEVSVPVHTTPIDELVKGYKKWEFFPMRVTKKKTGFGGRTYGVATDSPYDYYSIKMYRKNEEQAIRFKKKLPKIQQVEFCIDKASVLRDLLNKAGIESDSPLKEGIALNDLTNPAVQLILCRLLLDIPNHITLKTDAMTQIDYDAILSSDIVQAEKNDKKKEEKLQELLAFAHSRPLRERMKAKSRTRYYELKSQVADLHTLLTPAGGQQLHKFQEALRARVEEGKPKAPVSPVSYVRKTSRKLVKTPTPSTKSVLVAD